MPYLVTGAAGFLGSYVVDQLLAEGEVVVGLDRSWPGAIEAVVGPAAEDVVQVTGDVTDFALLARVAQEHGVDRVIHLAAELHARSADDPGQCIRSNVTGTHNVLELARLLPIRRVVTASSAALFGPAQLHDRPVSNDARLYAGDVYEASKIFGESEGEYYGKRFGVDNAAIRVGLAYGYGCRIGWGARLVDELLLRPRRGEVGRIPWRDASINWTYAVDAADAFVAASRATTRETWAYNLRGDHRTLPETIDVARALLPDATYELVEPFTHPWAQDFDDHVLQEEIGFRSTWTLEAGLADILARVSAAEGSSS